MTFLKNLIANFLGAAARRVVFSARPTIIGVTGSAGKTSTKEAIGWVLKQGLDKEKVLVSEGNLNTELGLPMVILGVKKPESKSAWLGILFVALGNLVFPSAKLKGKILVLEYGADAPGDIRRLVKIAPPHIAAVTIVGSAHTVNLGSLEDVAYEKSQLVRHLKKSDIVILNKGDSLVKKMAKATKAKVIFAEGIGLDLSREIAKKVANEGFGIQKEVAQKAIDSWVQPLGRLQLLRGKKDTFLIDDTYNANPPSTLLALNELKKQAVKLKAKRKIAVLGDMLELGAEEEKVHKGAALAAQKIADVLITVGKRYQETGIGKNFASPKDAEKFILSIIKKGDLVLLKGSQSMRIEKVTSALLADKSDQKKLVRQSDYWLKKPYKMP